MTKKEAIIKMCQGKAIGHDKIFHEGEFAYMNEDSRFYYSRDGNFLAINVGYWENEGFFVIEGEIEFLSNNRAIISGEAPKIDTTPDKNMEYLNIQY